VWTLLVVLFLKGAAPKGLNILLHAFGLQSLNPGNVLDLNYPTWSISVELIFYLVFPFLLKWMLNLSFNHLLWVSLMAWSLQSLQHILFVEYVYNGTKAMEEFISCFPLWHLPTFFAGMVTARCIVLSEKNMISKNASVLLILSLALLTFVILIPNPVLKYIHNGLLSPLFMLLILSLYYDRSFIHTVLSNKHVSNLGNLSYGLFIFQYPVWVLCTKIAGEVVVKSGWFFISYVLVLLLVAKLIHVFFERPMLRRLRKEV
jgi:peptidoglycan/LPS O-acetylase OafA/YrhL